MNEKQKKYTKIVIAVVVAFAILSGIVVYPSETMIIFLIGIAIYIMYKKYMSENSKDALSNLIQCKDCQSEISKNAVSCPKCGAPVPKPKKQSPLLYYVGIAFILYLAMQITNSSHSNSGTLSNSATPQIEETAQTNEITDKQKEAAMGTIALQGYTCDSIDGMNRFVFGEGYHVVCNDFRYSYDIENKGGNWIVTVK